MICFTVLAREDMLDADVLMPGAQGQPNMPYQDPH